MTLRDELEGQISRYGFISLSILKTILDRSRIHECLLEKGVNIRPSALDQISNHHSKLFALLVLSGREQSIEKYLSRELQDDGFPLLTENDLSKIEKEDGRLTISTMQWKIPFILNKHRHLDLPPEYVAPFLEERTVSHGAFGYVSRVRIAECHLRGHDSSSFVALKRIRKSDEDEWNVLMRETQTLRAREHPHIVPLLASWTENFVESGFGVKNLCLLFPYADMDMQQWLYLSKPPVDMLEIQQQRKAYIYKSILDLCGALAHIHREVGGLISSHHDLKPRNILLFGYTWKIADFGRTHLIDLKTTSDTEGRSGLGTFAYQPPEYWNESGQRANVRHGRAFDIWAMGCIIIEMATIAVHGWAKEALEDLKRRRKANRRRPRTFEFKEPAEDDSFHNNMNVVNVWHQELQRLDGSTNLTRVLTIAITMLAIDPQKRPTAWETELDLHELLNPDESNASKILRTRHLIQKPGPRDSREKQTPLHRAVAQGNMIRVQCLLESGWPTEVLDIKSLLENSKAPGKMSDEMLQILRFMDGQARLARLDETFPWIHALLRRNEVETLSSQDSHDDGSTNDDKRNADLPSGSKAKTLLHEHQESVLEDTADGQSLVVSRYPADVVGMYSIHDACRKGNISQVIDLVDKINSGRIRARLWTLPDATGKLPLHHAASQGSPYLISLLLQSFKVGNTSTFNPTSLITSRDSRGRTPLHLAALHGNPAAIEPLVNASADKKAYVHMEDDDNNTAWNLATKFHRREAADVLIKLDLE